MLLLVPAIQPTAAEEIQAGNVRATVFRESGTVTVFRVDGKRDNLHLANFWFRTPEIATANGGEISLNGLGEVQVEKPTDNQIIHSVVGDSLAARQQLTVLGGGDGSGSGTMIHRVTLENRTREPISLELFYGADFDLAFLPWEQNDRTVAKTFSRIQVEDPTAHLETIATPFPTAFAIFPGNADVLKRFMQDQDGPTELDDAPGVGQVMADVQGLRDAGYAFQWKRQLAPGEKLEAVVVSIYQAKPRGVPGQPR